MRSAHAYARRAPHTGHGCLPNVRPRHSNAVHARALSAWPPSRASRQDQRRQPIAVMPNRSLPCAGSERVSNKPVAGALSNRAVSHVIRRRTPRLRGAAHALL